MNFNLEKEQVESGMEGQRLKAGRGTENTGQLPKPDGGAMAGTNTFSPEFIGTAI